MNTPVSPWSKQTRDYWFFGCLTLSTLSIAYLFSSFMFVLLFAAVTVVVTWPLYTWCLERLKGRRLVAAVVCMLGLGLVVVMPFVFVGYLFVVEAVDVVGRGITFFSSGEFEKSITEARGLIEGYEAPGFVQWAFEFLPDDFDLLGSVLGPVKDGALLILNTTGTAVPKLINVVVTGAIDVVIFLFAVLTFYMEGPALLRVFANLLPMDDRYEEHLFEVFKEFATNMVLGSLATAVLQGLVATFGYWLVGVDGVVFFGLLTALFSFVPVVGTVLIWLPLSISVGLSGGLGPAVLLIVYSAVFTGGVDNVVKPLFLRGSSDIHPLLIFLAVFGGLAWMNLPGLLLGPVLVACFLSLYTIYCEDYLGLVPEAPDDEEPNSLEPTQPLDSPEVLAETAAEPQLEVALDSDGEDELPAV
jgi:predicted PurR-regulated permease PerM